jgi:hypothetical protein
MHNSSAAVILGAMQTQRRLLALTATLALLACGKDPAGPAVSLSGSWSGVVVTGEIVNMTLIHTNNLLSGSGVYSAGTFTLGMQVSGNVSGTNVSMVWQASGYQNVLYNARMIGVGGGEMRGALTNGGFNGDSLVLRKQ